jgi:hypothetical protein
MNRSFLKLLLAAAPAVALALAAARADDTNNFSGSITPEFQYISVSGNQSKFREDQWQQGGWSGGAEDATYQQKFGKDVQLNIEGRAIFNEDDYKLRLELAKADVWFVRAGFTQFRSYDDDQGAFFRGFTPSSFSSHSDPSLRDGDIFVEAGLTLPNLPKITVGYERQYRQGSDSPLTLGAVTQGSNTRGIYPAEQDIEEHTDIAKISLEQDVKNIHLSDQFRFEHYQMDNTTTDTALNLNTSASTPTTVQESYQNNAFFNTFLMDSHVKDTVYWSLGYLYTTLAGTGGLDVNTPPPLMTSDRNWVTRAVDVGTESHVVNLNAMFGPYKGFVFYGGLSLEKTKSDGFANALLTDGFSPTSTNLIHSSDNTTRYEETLGVRYTKIPFTTVYAEARVTEEQYDVDQLETADGAADLVLKANTDTLRQDYRIGFNTAPLPRITFAARYRHYIDNNDYNYDTDTVPGYPGFLTSQDFVTDEAMAKVTYRPCSKFNVALTYQHVDTAIQTGNEAVPLIVPQGTHQSGFYDSDIYSFNATLTPLARWYLTAYFSYQDTSTSSADNQTPTVQTYRGNVYTVMGTTGYALDNKTDLTVEYTYSYANDSQDNVAAGLPLGMDYHSNALLVGLSRKLCSHVVARLRYGYYENVEPSSGGFNNYRAQLVAANCTIRF